MTHWYCLSFLVFLGLTRVMHFGCAVYFDTEAILKGFVPSIFV